MIKTLLRSTIVGVVAAISLGVLAFALAPFFDAVGIYIAPFSLLAPILDKIPVTLINGLNHLLPVDGPEAGVGLILGTVLVFWTVILGAIYFAWVTWRHKRPLRDQKKQATL